MRGVITAVKHTGKGFFFIQGEDGNRYFGHKRLMVRSNSYDKFVWDGNGCEFDIGDQEEGKEPKAMNIVPDRVPDPRWEERQRNKRESKERAELNAIRKAENKRKREIQEAQAARIKKLHEQYGNYSVQKRVNDSWEFIKGNGRIIFMSKTLEEAKEHKRKLQAFDKNGRYRVVDFWKEMKRRGKEGSDRDAVLAVQEGV